jgi:outer membrane immunogenic protein
MTMTRRPPLLAVPLATLLAARLAAQQPPPPFASTPPPRGVPLEHRRAAANAPAGFYAGVDAGASWNRFTADPFQIQVDQISGIFVPQRGVVIVPGTTRGFGQARSDWKTGFTGGVHAGWNVLPAFGLLGIEAEWDAGSATASTSYGVLLPNTAITSPTPVRLHRTVKTGWTGLLRARVGRDLGSALVYATGGLAVARVSAAALDTITPGPSAELAAKLPSVTFAPFGSGRSVARTALGWTAGLGVERAVTRRASVGVEWRWTALGAKSYDVAFNSDTTLTALQTHAVVTTDPARLRVSGSRLTARVNLWLGGR